MIPKPKDVSARVVYGGLVALFSFACFAAMQAFGKVLSPAYDPCELIFWRHLGALILMLAYIGALRRYALLRTEKPGWIALRSLIGTACLGAMFAANMFQPLSQTTILLFTSVFLTPVLAFFLLGERVGPWRWAAIGAGYFGVLVALGAPTAFSLAGTVFALAAAALQSGVGISLRYLGRTEHAFTLAFYFILFGAVVGALAMPFVGRMPQREDIWALLGMTVTGLAGQVAISEAYRHAPPAVVAPMSYSGLAWAVLFDLSLWGAVPEWQTLAGGAIIVASNLLILWRERKSRCKSEGNKDTPPQLETERA